MLLILERDQFLKLFKFGEIKISINRFIDSYDVENGKSKIPLEILDNKMPLFEQDHEILILEIPKEKLVIGTDITVKVSSVNKIYPLTEEAERYLVGRMHPLIVIQRPVFENLVHAIKIKRDFNLRINAWNALSFIFKVDKELANDYIPEIEDGVRTRLGQISKNKRKQFLHNLICFNRNPIYPSGNIEYLYKVGSVFVQMKDGKESDFERGPYYKFLEVNSSKFSKLKLDECISIIKKSSESKLLLDELSKQYPKIDIFSVGVWFLYFKDVLNKNNSDLVKIKDDIENLKGKKLNEEVAIILLIIGMLFNFDNLYGSIYELNSIPIFSSNTEPGILEQNKNLKRYLQEEKAKFDQLKKEFDITEKLANDLKYKIRNDVNPTADSQKQIKSFIDSVLEFHPLFFDELKEKKPEIINKYLKKDDGKELKVDTTALQQTNMLVEEIKGVKTDSTEVLSITTFTESEVDTIPIDAIDVPSTSLDNSSDDSLNSNFQDEKDAKTDITKVSIVNEPDSSNVPYHAELTDKANNEKYNSELIDIPFKQEQKEKQKSAELTTITEESELNEMDLEVVHTNVAKVLSNLNFKESEGDSIDAIFSQSTSLDNSFAEQLNSVFQDGKISESDVNEENVVNEPVSESSKNHTDSDTFTTKHEDDNSELAKTPYVQDFQEKEESLKIKQSTKGNRLLLSSKNKDNLNKGKIENQKSNDIKVKKAPTFANSTKGIFANLSLQFSEPDKLFYDEKDLKEIVRIAKEEQILSESKDEITFEEAIFNYLPKGAKQDPLLNEIEILQTDLRLSQEVADKLRSIITKIKE